MRSKFMNGSIMAVLILTSGCKGGGTHSASDLSIATQAASNLKKTYWDENCNKNDNSPRFNWVLNILTIPGNVTVHLEGVKQPLSTPATSYKICYDLNSQGQIIPRNLRLEKEGYETVQMKIPVDTKVNIEVRMKKLKN